MEPNIYMIVSAAMRYVFFFIIAFILVRLFVLSLREWRSGSKRRRHMRTVRVGYIRMISPQSFSDEKFRLYRETLIGRSRSCDITIPLRSIKRKHAIIFERGGDMFITACYPSRFEVRVNDVSIGRGDKELTDGDIVTIGSASFSVHFAESNTYEDTSAHDDQNRYDSYEGADDDEDIENMFDPFDDDNIFDA